MNYSWTDSQWLGFDTETTGVDVSLDHILTASLIEYDPATAQADPKNWIIDPGVEVPEKSISVHGLTTEYIRTHGAAPAEALEQIAQAIALQAKDGSVLVAFNASYDIVILNENLKRWNLRPLEDRINFDQWTIIDPLICDRALCQYRKGKRTLDLVADYYHVEKPDQLHNAEVDTRVTLGILRSLVDKYPQLRAMQGREVMMWQARQHALWARGLNQWKQKKGYGHPIDEQWGIAAMFGIVYDE
ncbi:MAG: exonuclease domain-containing protein [Actinomycetaceae bacterium]|nr:exonuclease domain-containing protein [Actinomycetaceae bacterium]